VAAEYDDLRPLMFSIAYRMSGSVADAEDIVQEAFLRYHRAGTEQGVEVASPRAYLSAVTTRLAIDRLRSARVRRETYLGEWLPEPLVTEPNSEDPTQRIEDAETISMAFLLLLERLSPVERAVFLLRDVFDYGYEEIASIIDKSDVNCRQVAVRARRHIRENKPRFEASRRRREELATRFFAAIGEGDLHGLVGLLAADAAAYGDGGGKVPSWAKPIFGQDRVARLLAGVGRQLREVGASQRRLEINGQPGVMFFDASGELINAMTVDIADGRVQTVRSIINPDKLRHLGPLADISAALKQRRSRRP
jgi:RNA polymerase sigma-70 factor, ECF subfamily